MFWRACPLFAVCLAVLVGCANDLPNQVPAGLRSFRWMQEDLLAVELAVIRLPLGDDFATRDLWREVDELVLPLEKRLTLEANGFRVGVISGNVPAELQRLLTNKDTCIRSRRLAVRPGHARFVALVQPRDVLNLQTIEGGETAEHSFEQAVPGFQLRLENEEEITRIGCQPCVQHGQAQRLLQPTDDLSDWELQGKRPEQLFSTLAWELKLSPTEYAVVGCAADRPQSLGYACLVETHKDGAYQHLIVFRSVPRPSEPSTVLLRPNSKPATKEPPPLAQQSVVRPRLPLSRGQSP